MPQPVESWSWFAFEEFFYADTLECQSEASCLLPTAWPARARKVMRWRIKRSAPRLCCFILGCLSSSPTCTSFSSQPQRYLRFVLSWALTLPFAKHVRADDFACSRVSASVHPRWAWHPVFKMLLPSWNERWDGRRPHETFAPALDQQLFRFKGA